VTTTSRVPAVIDWLVSGAQGSALIGAASPAVIVIDGPTQTPDTETEPLHLWVGADPEQLTAAGMDFTQSWPVLDYARTKDEDGTVVLVADAWGGGDSAKTVRDQCAAIVAGVELLVRGNGSTGPGDASMGGLVLWSSVDVGQWRQRKTQQGAGCSCVIQVTYRARLVTTGP
jgi:hypothetical protein